MATIKSNAGYAVWVLRRRLWDTPKTTPPNMPRVYWKQLLRDYVNSPALPAAPMPDSHPAEPAPTPYEDEPYQHPHPWVDYTGERDKELYDVRLKNGAIVYSCYPNGAHFNPLTIRRRRGPAHPPIHDRDVVQIRLTWPSFLASDAGNVAVYSRHS